MRDQKSAIYQMCLGKPRHETKGKAEAAARSLVKRFDQECRVVPCSNCNGWHVNKVKTDG